MNLISKQILKKREREDRGLEEGNFLKSVCGEVRLLNLINI